MSSAELGLGWAALRGIPSSKAEAVALYAQLGLHPIALHGADRAGVCTCREGLGCKRAGKHPLENGWADGALDVFGLVKTVSGFPQGNVGLRCGRQRDGSVLVGIDVDGEEGEISVTNFPLPETLEALTPSGGRHLFYRTQLELRTRTGVLKGVDCRCVRGQLVVAPSSRGGRYYEWVRAREPAPLPPEWLPVLAPPDPQKRVAPEPEKHTPASRNLARARGWLAQRDPAISGQNGHTKTFTTARSLWGMGLSEPEVRALMIEYNQRCQPPWSRADLERKIAEARTRGEGEKFPDRAGWIPTSEPSQPEPEEKEEDDPPLFADTSGWNLAERPPARRWLLRDRRTGKPVVEMGRVSCIAGDGGVGKSYAILQLAVSIILGLDWLQTFIPATRGRVALFMGEDHEDECKERLHKIANVLSLTPDQRRSVLSSLDLALLSGRDLTLLERAAGGQTLPGPLVKRIVRQLGHRRGEGGYALVAFDPLARFGAEAEGNNADATKLIEVWENLAVQAPGEPHVLISSHSSKVANRDAGVDIRGVTGLRNAFRTVFTLKKVLAPKMSGAYFAHDKSNSCPEAEPIWLVRYRDEGWDGALMGGVLRPATEEEVEKLQEQNKRPSKEEREAVFLAILEQTIDRFRKATEPLGVRKVCESVDWASAGISSARGNLEAAVRRSIKQLEFDGLISRVSSGRIGSWVISEEGKETE